MRRPILWAWAACVGVAAVGAETEILSPGFAPSKVSADGSVIEPWGAVALRLLVPAGAATDQQIQGEPMPAAVTVSKAGPVSLRQIAYRAPIWPEGTDVIEAAAENCGDKSAEAQIELSLPEKMAVGETLGIIEGRPSLALPLKLRPTREEREWGCAGGVSNLRGWAKPNGPCDPAFQNIAAGMGGVPIRYRFAVSPGGAKAVVLGFCESHHTGARSRVMIATVEGALPQNVDPIARWGRHVPGLVRFSATDADRDGRLDVTVAPDPASGDRNPILNAIWIFDPGSVPDDAAILAGAGSPPAERYVDVGGENDQSLYPPGNLRYTIPLKPGERREILVLLRSPGSQAVPDPTAMVWTADALRKAAEDVWRARWPGSVPAHPNP